MEYQHGMPGDPTRVFSIVRLNFPTNLSLFSIHVKHFLSVFFILHYAPHSHTPWHSLRIGYPTKRGSSNEAQRH